MGLWLFILAAIGLDAVLLVAGRFVPVRWRRIISPENVSWRDYGTRLLRIGILALVMSGLNDIMIVNSKLYKVETPTTSFTPLYPDIRKNDSDPFPAVNLPHSPVAFEMYEAEMRNWGLNEGWIPTSLPGVFSWEAGTITDLPRWAIVSNAYGGASQDFAQRFVDSSGFQEFQCYALEIAPGDPCEMNGGNAAVLYEREDVLPYTFIVPADALLNLPSKLHADNVYPARVIAHRQDSITIQGATPPVQGDYYLVVEEANYPGWRVTADGVPLETMTVQTYPHTPDGDRGFIGVLMPVGEHTYNLWFEPPGFLLGIVVTLVTVIGIGWYLTRKRKVMSYE
jgi:hypothetical protein